MTNNLPDNTISPHTKDRIAWSGELEFLGATEDDRTGRTAQFRIIRKLDELGAAHPFSAFTRRRRGHAGTRFEAVFARVGDEHKITGEAMLLNWSDGPKGATVKFLVGVEAERHPFLDCTRRTREAAGTSFMTVLLELDDDDEVVNQVKRERFEKAQQHLSNVAAMMIKHPRFHEWLYEVEGSPAKDEVFWSIKAADAWLKMKLSIDSKSELDKGTCAAAAFIRLRAQYTEWLEANNYDHE